MYNFNANYVPNFVDYSITEQIDDFIKEDMSNKICQGISWNDLRF